MDDKPHLLKGMINGLLLEGLAVVVLIGIARLIALI